MFSPNSLPLGNSRPLKQAIYGSKILVRRHPLLAKAVPTGLGFAFGDCLTQMMNRKPDQRRQAYNWARTLQMGVLGAAIAGPIGLSFLRWLEAYVPGTSAVALAVKFTLDQVLGCALWQAAFLAINPDYRKSAAQLVEQVQAGWEEQSTSIRRKIANKQMVAA